MTTTDSQNSSSLDEPIGFSLLSGPESARMQAAAQAVRAQGLSPEGTAIALASLYLSYEHPDPTARATALYLPAIQVLQGAINDETQNPMIYLLQGDGFIGMGLAQVAQQSYQAGLTLARQQGDIRTEAELLDGLAIVATSEGNCSLARTYTQDAIARYTHLNEPEQVTLLQTRLAAPLCRGN